jgi:hypothetical protein
VWRDGSDLPASEPAGAGRATPDTPSGALVSARFVFPPELPYACSPVADEHRLTAPSFSGLGHRPFTAAARVRIPLGSLHVGQMAISTATPQHNATTYGPVAQLVSVPPCHGGGRGFKSRQGRHGVRSSDRSSGQRSKHRVAHGWVAQLVERSTENRKVRGSTPRPATAGSPRFTPGAFSLPPSPAPTARAVAGRPGARWRALPQPARIPLVSRAVHHSRAWGTTRNR